jgi:hypothetical protein
MHRGTTRIETESTAIISSDGEIARIIAFGEGIGFAFEEGQATGAFIPGIRLGTGMRVVFDRAALLSPGDMLHEMGL